MATFLATKINTTERDITDPTTPLQIMLSLKDKKNAGYLKTVFLGRR